MGKTYEGADLTNYLDRFQAFFPRITNVREEFAGLTEESNPWTRERFLALFATRSHVYDMASTFLDSVEPAGVVEHGRAAIGQAYLKCAPYGPIVLHLTGRARTGHVEYGHGATRRARLAAPQGDPARVRWSHRSRRIHRRASHFTHG